jgi:RimJ/RimL family protein N-acetyltransferase
VVQTSGRARWVSLSSGHSVQIRPVRPEDASGLARAFDQLSEQSRYRRFFTGKSHLPQGAVDAAANVDHRQHEALVAVPPHSREIVGEIRFVRDPSHTDTADLAMTVVDSWQGRGLGTALLRAASHRAQELGIRYFTADVLAENRPMLKILQGLESSESTPDGTTVGVRIDLTQQADEEVPDLCRELLQAAGRGDLLSLPAHLRALLSDHDAMRRLLVMPIGALLRAFDLSADGSRAASGVEDRDRSSQAPDA